MTDIQEPERVWLVLSSNGESRNIVGAYYNEKAARQAVYEALAVGTFYSLWSIKANNPIDRFEH